MCQQCAFGQHSMRPRLPGSDSTRIFSLELYLAFQSARKCPIFKTNIDNFISSGTMGGENNICQCILFPLYRVAQM